MILQIITRRLRGQTLSQWAAMFDPIEAQASVEACIAEYTLELERIQDVTEAQQVHNNAR